METLHTQFSQALTNIEVNGAKRQRAIAAHTEIQELLYSNDCLRDWGISTRLIGSYSRQTGIYPGRDVDVFARLTNLDTTASPEVVYRRVEEVVVAKYGDRATSQTRSIKVEFSSADGVDTSFAVDTVPAVRNGTRWAIPSKDQNLWIDSPSRWVTTNPEQFGELSRVLNTAYWSPTVQGQDAYKPIVKLIRQVREVHLGDQKPGGLYAEFAVFDVWNNRHVSGSEWGSLLEATLRTVADRFGRVPTQPLLDPGLDTPVNPALDASVWLHASDKFQNLADTAAEALTANRCEAAVRWREILGANSRGQVFPLPPGCDARGFATTGMAGLAATRPREAQGFG